MTCFGEDMINLSQFWELIYWDTPGDCHVQQMTVESANFKSGTVWTGDNLPVLRSMNSECVDLIYLDPPFTSTRNHEIPIGSKAAGASFRDMWTLDDVDVHEHGELADRNPAAYAVIEATRQAHGKGMMSYLIFMAVRD